MAKKKIRVEVSWTENNYCGSWRDDMGGCILVTAKTLQKLKDDFEESLRLHIEGCIADGDQVPGYLAKGEYEPEYNLDAAALIRKPKHTLQWRLSAAPPALTASNCHITPTE